MSLTNPYKIDFNLETTKEHRQLFNLATKGLDDDDKFDLSLKKSKDFMEEVEEANQQFAWGPAFNAITITPGNSTRSGQGAVTKSLATEPKSITLEEVVRNAQRIWSGGATNNRVASTTEDRITQMRIRSSMIGKWLRNSLTKQGRRKIMLKKKKFQYVNTDGSTEDDGPTMFKLIYDMVKPNTRACVSSLKSRMTTYKLSDYGEDVTEMLTAMDDTYNEILQLGGTHDDYILNLFAGLKTSSNKVFSDFIGRKEDDYQGGDDITPEHLSDLAITKFNNMLELKQIKIESKEEAKEKEKFLTLATQLKSVINDHQAQKRQDFQGEGKNTIEEWRMTKTEDVVTRNGKEFYWCPHHKQPGRYDGLYVSSHKPEEHDEFMKNKRRRYKGNQNKRTKTETPSLQLKSKLQEALTSGGLSDNQMKSFMAQIDEDSKNY